MLRTLVIVALVIVSSTAPSALGGEREDIAAGNAALDRSQFEDAIGFYSKALQDPGASSQRKAVAYYDRGNVYQRLKQFDVAISDFTESIKLDPTQAWPYNNRCFSYMSIKKYKNAIDDCDEAVRLDPKSTHASSILVMIYALAPELEPARDRTKEKWVVVRWHMPLCGSLEDASRLNFMVMGPGTKEMLIENIHQSERSGKCIAFEENRCLQVDNVYGVPIPTIAKLYDPQTKRTFFYNMAVGGEFGGGMIESTTCKPS